MSTNEAITEEKITYAVGLFERLSKEDQEVVLEMLRTLENEDNSEGIIKNT